MMREAVGILSKYSLIYLNQMHCAVEYRWDSF